MLPSIDEFCVFLRHRMYYYLALRENNSLLLELISLFYLPPFKFTTLTWYLSVGL